MEAEAFGAGLRQIRARVDEMEERVRTTARAVELVQEQSAQTGESVRGSRQEVDEQFRFVDGRMRTLEHTVGEARSMAEAEMSRLRNEMALAMHELGQRLDERFSQLRAIADEGAAGVIREAQTTCVRLADDALGVAEASQRKVTDLERRTEANFEVLRVDIIGVRAELAGSLKVTNSRQSAVAMSPLEGFIPTAGAATTPALGAGLHSDKVATSSKELGGENAAAIAEQIERRLATRMGNQVLQLSEVLRRVVQAQAAMTRHGPTAVGSERHRKSNRRSVSAGRECAPTAIEAGSAHSAPEPDCGFISDGCGAGGAVSGSEAQRRTAIDELYRELRQLEDCGAAAAAGGSPPYPSLRMPKGSRPRSVV